MRRLLLLCLLGCVVAAPTSDVDLKVFQMTSSGWAPSPSFLEELNLTANMSPGNRTTNTTENGPMIDIKPADTKVQSSTGSGVPPEPTKTTEVQPHKRTTKPSKSKKKKSKRPPSVWHPLSNSGSEFPPASDENVDQASFTCFTPMSSSNSSHDLTDPGNETSVVNGTMNATETGSVMNPQPADTKETDVHKPKAPEAKQQQKKRRKKTVFQPGKWHGLSASFGFPTAPPEEDEDQKKTS